MKSILVVVTWFVFLGYFNVRAQNRAIDSLNNLARIKKGPEQADVLNQLTFEWFSFDFDRAGAMAREAYQISEKNDYKKGMAESIIYLGVYELMSGNLELSSQNLNKGIAYAQQAKDPGVEGYGLLQLGNLYRSMGKYDSAGLLYDLSYSVLKDSVDPRNLSILYKSMARYNGVLYKYDLQEKYLLRALKIRERFNDLFWRIDCYIALASFYSRTSEHQKAKYYLDLAESQDFDYTNQKELRYDLNNERALLLFRMGQFSEALALFFKIKTYLEQVGLRQMYVNLLLNVSTIHEEQGGFEMALKNSLEALTVAKENGYPLEEVRAQTQLGRIFTALNQPDQAIQSIQQALQTAKSRGFETEKGDAYNALATANDNTGKYSEALLYYDSALHIRERLGDKIGVASVISNIGFVYEHLNKLDKALELQIKALAIDEAVNHKFGMTWSYQLIGNIYAKLKKWTLAEEYLNKSQRLAAELNANEIMLEVFKSKRNLYEASGQLKEALVYAHRVDDLRDSVFNTQLTGRITSLLMTSEIDKKNLEIATLNQKQLLQQAEIGRQRLLIGLIIGGALVLAIVAYAYYYFYRKVKNFNMEISEQNEEIQTQAEELRESNQILVKLNEDIQQQKEQIEAQAEELLRSNESIATINSSLESMVEERTAELRQAYKELDTFFYRSSHDFRRPLTTFLGLAEVAKITVKDKNALELFEKVHETASNLDKMLVKLQSISDLGAQQLIYKEVFLRELFEELIAGFRQEISARGIRVELDINLNKPLQSYPALIKIIAENLVENCILFNGATDPFIKITARDTSNKVILSIQDNGEGIPSDVQSRIFDMYFRGSERSKGNGLGLYIVKKTIQKLDGSIFFQSSQQGTLFTVEIPSVVG